MAITPREKELIAVGISVAAGCRPCTNYHIKKARIEGAGDVELSGAIVEAINVRYRAADTMKAHALGHVHMPTPGYITENIGKRNRLNEMLAIGAAFGVNCVTTLEKHLAVAEERGITPAEIREIIKLGNLIKNRATAHAEKVFAPKEEVACEREVAGWPTLVNEG